MKKIYMLLLIVLISKVTQAQDLLVTTNGDSINCKIVDEKGSFVLYKILEGDSYVSRAINKQSISKSENGFYLRNPELAKNNSNSTSKKQKYSSTNFNIGYNRLKLLDFYSSSGMEVIDKYNESLANGMGFNLELKRWFTKRLGIDIRYDLYSSKALEYKMPYTNPLGSTSYGPFSDKIKIHTFSPGFAFRTPIANENNYLIINTSFDYNLYINDFTYLGTPGKLKSKRYGYSFGMSYERVLNKNFAIGLNAKYRISSLNKVGLYVNGDFDEIDLTEEQEISINRYSFGLYLGIR